MSNAIYRVLNSCLRHGQSRLAQPCLLCAARSRAGPLCPDCAAELPRLPAQRCPQCALPTPAGEVCGHCLKRPPAFDHTRAVFRYAFPVDVLVQRLKYASELACAAWLAEQLAASLALSPPPDLLIAMPLHPRRLRERGFNQAALLAGHLAGRLNVPLRLDACRRLRDTPPQVGLAHQNRRRNIRGAFVCETKLAGRRVALVDDVMTSGASLNELAKVVKRAGAAAVESWVIARTVAD